MRLQVAALDARQHGIADPDAPDNTAPVRGMAVQLKTDDGQEWRITMNSLPFFAAATPQAFQAWVKSAPRPDSLGNMRDNGVNTFRLTDAQGSERMVRWSMRPHTGDTGSGIAAQHLPYLFDRFYRGDAARRRNGRVS